MPLYRKKPGLIEAMQLTENNVRDVQDWCGRDDDGLVFVVVQWHYPEDAKGPADKEGWLVLTTVHGEEAIARPGDWVIRETSMPGRFYPCKPDIFDATYEPAEVSA